MSILLLLHNLLWTIGLEFPLYYFALRKEKLKFSLPFAILVNVFTLPLAMLAYHEWGISLWLLEAIVGVVEGLALWRFSQHKLLVALALGVGINFASQKVYLMVMG